jgi:alkylation response protein AidB-like acyl-CoA dehydrogenase
VSQAVPTDEIEALAGRFFADAALVDAAPTIPASHVKALAEAGLYGAMVPKNLGGLGLGMEQVCDVIEVLASGCLASTFVWIQHFGLTRALSDPQTPEHLREWLPKAVRGDLIGGVSLAGLLPGPPRLRAEPSSDGWVLSGEAPWVSGWGVVDVLLVSARGPGDTVVQLIVDARDCPGIRVDRAHLSAMDASATVRITFAGLRVPHNRFVIEAPFAPTRPERHGIRTNGSLALGVVRRCCAMIGPSPLDGALTSARDALNQATPDTIYQARAEASALAVRAASALMVHRGSRAAFRGDSAERLMREAAILLVFGSRPGIKAALVDHFAPLPRDA